MDRSNIRGNHGYEGYTLTRGGSTQGFGTQANNSIVANLSVAGKAGDEVYIQASSFLCLKYDQGSAFQAVGGDIDVSYTLENWNYACSEQANKQGLVHWCNTVTVKKDTIHVNDIPAFSALRIQFKTDSILYIAAR